MSQPQVNVIRVLDPFDPKQNTRETWELDPAKPKNLRDFFPVVMVEHVVSINGKTILDEDDNFKKHYVEDGDSLVICPVPTGGDSSKEILRMVAMIAIMVVAWEVAPLLGLSGWGASAFVMGATMVGGVLINALLPNKPLSTDFGQKDPGDSPTYGIDGAKNTSLEGIPVPVVYGQFRYAGNIIGLYTHNYGEYQELYMLFNAGEGYVAGLDSVEINDQPYWNFQNVELDFRYGWENQSPPNWFGDTIIPNSVNQKLTSNWTYWSTNNIIDRVRFDLVFPTGLYQISERDGRKEAFGVGIEIWYKLQGSGTWLQMPIGSVVTGYSAPRYFLVTGTDWQGTPTYQEVSSLPAGYWADGLGQASTGAIYTTVTQTFYYNNGDGDGYSVNQQVNQQVGYWQADASYGSSAQLMIWDTFTETLRKQIESPPLAQGMYDFAIKRYTWDVDPPEYYDDWIVFDDVWISDINEIIADDVQYTNTATVGLKIRVSEQLSGIPKVTYMHRGKYILCWDYNNNWWYWYNSNNPAFIALDILWNTRYGAGLTGDRVDLEKFKEWGAFCYQQGLTFDGAFDTASNVWDALQYVCRAGHASIVMIGTKYSVTIEKAANPVMMFSVANMIEGSFKQHWASLDERVNEVDVSFFDASNSYKQKTIKVVDQAAQANTQPRNASVTLLGCVNAEKAYKEGVLMLNMNKYIKQSVEFEAPLEAIACTIGDVIYVQHDMPQWGHAGRIESVTSTNQLVLDREVPFEGGKTYKFLTVIDAIQRWTGTVTSVSGNIAYVSGVSPMLAKRMTIPGWTDAPIVKFGWGYVELEPGYVNGGWVGQPATFVDTDVIEERNVAIVTGRTIILSSPLSALPNVFGQWMYGETEKVKKPFRVRSITGSEFTKRQITAIEYNASMYDMSGVVVPTPNYSDLDMQPENVTILGLSEELIKIGQAILTRVTLMWDSTQSNYSRAEVHLSVNYGPAFLLGTFLDRATFIANDGDRLEFRVVAMDALGQKTYYWGSPTYTHTVVGKTAPPANVAWITAQDTEAGIELKWAPISDLDLRGYEVRLGGSSWSNAEVIVQYYSGTSFLDKKRRVGAYTYRIKAVDILNNFSTAEATTTLVVPSLPNVTGFNVALVQRQLVYTWNAVTGPNLLGYEIRVSVGDDFNSAVPVVTNYNGTSYFEPRRVPNNYVFWIAAVSTLGDYSTFQPFSLTIPRIATPTNVHAEPRVGDILVTWDGVNDVDLSHYEVRVGPSWETGEVIVAGYSGTSFIDGKRGVGTYHYMVKAYGSPGNESLSVGAYDLVLVAPQSVSGFDCVQNGDRIEFRWNANPEYDLIGYEIREGTSWSTGVKIVELMGTTYTMPASSIPQDRIFWIKAIVEPGIESDVAIFSTTDVAEPVDRNVIYEVDEFATGFTGNKYKMSVVTGKLQLNAGESYGEYTFPVTLPQLYRARNSLAVAFDAIIPDTETWQTATYPWNSAQAQRTWTIGGDVGQIGLEFYISRYVGLPVGYLEVFSLNNSTTGDAGTVATTATNVTYAPGRYLNGVRVQTTTTLAWTKTVAQYFNVTFWSRVEDTNPSVRQVFWKGVKSGGIQWLDVSYNPTSSKFELRDNANNVVQVTPPGTFAVGDQIFFGVVQTASERKLYVGQVGKGTAQGSGAFAAIGALATMQLHP